MPAIRVERVLLAFDEPKGLEHLVREVTFTKVDKPFGFVIPTPSKPGVFKMDDVRWSSLERKFPMSVSEEGTPMGFGSGGRLGGSGGVKVIEAKRVGSFAAIILQAEDGKALKGWLDRNRFVTTPSSEQWLDRYAKLKFFFTALRFEPGFFKEKVKHLGHYFGSETLRITFETPVPYYPYAEPDRDDLASERVLALWLMTNGPRRVPVALVSGEKGASYQRPLREGRRSPPAGAEALRSAIGETAWSAMASPDDRSDWHVQVFEDQKRSRHGFGDVLLVPETPRELAPTALEKVAPLLPLLDPSLSSP